MRLQPMLAKDMDERALDTYLSDPNWVAEQKLDGHRILLVVSNGNVAALNRSGARYTRGLPACFDNVVWPAGSWVFDGELVDETFWVFDILEANGLIEDGSVWSDRRMVLDGLFSLWSAADCIRLVTVHHTLDEKCGLLVRVKENCGEGLIFKHANRRYTPGGRTGAFLKYKFTETADVVILAVRDDGKESAKLGVIDDGKVIEVGRTSLIGKPDVNVGDVVEVKYLYMGAGSRLYQPTLLRVRDDKMFYECSPTQFKHVNKEVLT